MDAGREASSSTRKSLIILQIFMTPVGGPFSSLNGHYALGSLSVMLAQIRKLDDALLLPHPLAPIYRSFLGVQSLNKIQTESFPTVNNPVVPAALIHW